MENRSILTLKFEGPRVKEGRVPVDELIYTLRNLQLCLKRLGQTLIGEIPEYGPGRIKKEIETACNLEVIAVDKGCFSITLTPFKPTHKGEPLFAEQGVSLGDASISKLIEGISYLGEARPSRLPEFDYAVLVPLREFGRITRKGINKITFEYSGNGYEKASTLFNKKVRDNVIKNILDPIKSHYKLKGSLKEVDLHSKKCRVYPPVGRYIQCAFTEAHENIVKEALDTYVRVIGEAKIRGADGLPELVTISDIEILEMTPEMFEPKTSAVLTASKLLDSGLIGIWQDREDIGESTEFARKLRKETEERNREKKP